jgi:hypothetical protein
MHLLAVYHPKMFTKTIQILIDNRLGKKNIIVLFTNKEADEREPLHLLSLKCPQQVTETIELLIDEVKGIGKKETIERLHKADKNRSTVLNYLMLYGPEHFYQTIHRLIEDGVDETTQNSFLEMIDMKNMTFLHYSVVYGADKFSETIQLLFKNGIKNTELNQSLCKKNKYKNTPFHLLAINCNILAFINTVEVMILNNCEGFLNLLLFIENNQKETALDIFFRLGLFPHKDSVRLLKELKKKR